ncbi:hypothetical protein R1sor_024126 [Riccia sorocarpa]|uniref:Guanylate cyclase domain-containing protein n=1 Tax=Riccia sorocarpa TaxID=122646 RepID=A0ABD3GST8_9MARC
MSGCERNYDFGDLINCASGLNRLASLEFGKEWLQVGGKHVKQDTIWSMLHPRPPGQYEPDLASFTNLETDSEVVDALKTGLREAQYSGGSLSPDLWDVTTPTDVPEGQSDEDRADDLSFIGHKTRHVMTEVLNEVLSTESASKIDPMVSHEGHQVYKASLVSLLVGNPTLSKDRLSRIKQTIFFNGVKPKARVPGVPVCILDVGSDCAVLFDCARVNTSTRGRQVAAGRKRARQDSSKEVWFGRVQKIQRKYNGKWGKTRSEIDLLNRPVPQPGEGSICQVLFNWNTAIAGSRVKFRYEGTDLQWIDIESVITVVTMKVENGIRPTWALDVSDREKVDQFVSTA